MESWNEQNNAQTIDITKLHKIQCLGELRNPLYYDKETGKMYRHQRSVGGGRRKGVYEIIEVETNGYLRTNVVGGREYIHSVVTQEFLGHRPNRFEVVVDHINGNKLDNRIENLQLVSNRGNTIKGNVHKNKPSGLPLNVTFDKSKGKFKVALRVNGKEINFGMYKSVEAATIAAKVINRQVILNKVPLEEFKSPFVSAKRFKQIPAA